MPGTCISLSMLSEGSHRDKSWHHRASKASRYHKALLAVNNKGAKDSHPRESRKGEDVGDTSRSLEVISRGWTLLRYYWTLVQQERDKSTLNTLGQNHMITCFLYTDAYHRAGPWNTLLWPPNGKNWLTRKDPDAGKDWRQKEKGTMEDEVVGWHHQLDGHEFDQAPGVGDGQGSLACCSPWGCKESGMTKWLNWTTPVAKSLKSQKWVGRLLVPWTPMWAMKQQHCSEWGSGGAISARTLGGTWEKALSLKVLGRTS